jgi:AcrR family transcriptional regulator
MVTATTRPTRALRREQLLDAAAELVGQRGVGGVTMEGVAARAGASKALPYRHFPNADAVLAALYHRELDVVAERVVAAVEHVKQPEKAVRAAMATYFQVVDERGAILGALAGAGSPVPDLEGAGRERLPELVARLLMARFSIDQGVALPLAVVVLGIATSATDAVGQGLVERAAAERVATTAVLGAVAAVVQAEGDR